MTKTPSEIQLEIDNLKEQYSKNDSVISAYIRELASEQVNIRIQVQILKAQLPRKPLVGTK